MGIKLPKWEELSRDEQVPIVNLPLEGNYVVVGGPGTGKTILALYRAARWKTEKKNEPTDILFLVFNNPLVQYIDDSIKKMELEDATVNSYFAWLWAFYRQQTRTTVPQLGPYQPDWDAISKGLTEVMKSKKIEYLILDEAQDFPPQLLEILSKISKSVTIFGDSQQALKNAKSTTQDFTSCFNAGRRVYFLNRNYRNTKEISDVAHLFYMGDKNDIPATPRRTGPKPRLTKVTNFDECVKIVANFSNNNPGLTVGVLVPGSSGVKSRVKEFYEAVKVKSKQTVQCYINKKDLGGDSFNFEDEGIKILSYNTMKGLEFDAVFMPDLDDRYFMDASELKYKAIYVASTRAKDTLVYMYTEDNSSFVLKTLKGNLSLLESSNTLASTKLPF